MNSKIKDAGADFLFEAILQLQNLEECYQFFEDLCTVSEIKALSQRIVVAKMLSDKRVYSDIVAATGASTATISRVNRSLIYGCVAYDMVFGRMKENNVSLPYSEDDR
ncbi:MAG: TrpR-like protein, YerC/YecD [Clostridia bacterium]|nr:TrpR-like protein, YerC/YecD [Clostridia bacterium]